jgi:hypothetical protein
MNENAYRSVRTPTTYHAYRNECAVESAVV